MTDETEKHYSEMTLEELRAAYKAKYREKERAKAEVARLGREAQIFNHQIQMRD